MLRSDTPSPRGEPDLPGASTSAADIAEQDAFSLLVEIADLVQEQADGLADAALSGDRARARLHVCLLSRAVRSALVTVNEILKAERNRT
jgi:hypothetical protein